MREYKEFVQDSKLSFEQKFGDDLQIDDIDIEHVTEMLQYAREHSFQSYHMWMLAESILIYLDEYGKEMTEQIESNPDMIKNIIENATKKKEEVKNEQQTE